MGMNFTFGIITDGQNWDRVDKIVESIVHQNIPEHDIIIVGPRDIPHEVLTVGNLIYPDMWLCRINSTKVNYYVFESDKTGWITKKKNIIAERAKNENLVLLHDYVSLDNGWYDGFKEFGDDWDVCMTRIENLDGSRFRDWIICDDPEYCHPYNWDAKIAPYEYNKTQWMYVSGAYIIAKTKFMRDNPFNESLKWGQGEDVEWSRRVRHRWNYKLNLNSKAKLLKQQEIALSVLS